MLATWVNQGPASILGGQSEGIVGTGSAANPDNPVSGAVEAIAAQPNNADIVYAATTNGGVWKTTNATAASPHWTPLTDTQITLSSGDIEFDPLDPTYQTLYVGTGSFSSSGNDGTPGRGLLKTTDGGATWTNLNPGGIFNGRYVKSVVPTKLDGGNVLLVGTFYDGGGVYRSPDGGTTFTRLSGASTSGLPAAGVSILVPDPFNANVFYAGVPGDGVYRSDDGGATWTPKDVGLVSPTVSNDRVELAPSPAQSGVLFATLINNGVPVGFYRTITSGDSWTPMDLAGTNDPGGFVGTNPGEEEGEEEVPGAQGFLHFALLADLTNPFVVFASGDRQPDQLPSSVGARQYSGRAFRGDASLPSGQQWEPITNNFANPDGVVGGTSPHADSRDMVFDANGNILQGNDGGIYRLVNPSGTASTRRWDSAIGDLRNTEFISTAYSSVSHTVFGGAQDVGTSFQISTDNSVPWGELLGGDGGVVGVDDTSNPGYSTRYTSFQFFGFFNRSTWDADNNLLDLQPVGLVVNGTGGATLGQFDPTIQFYQPFKLNAVDPTRVIIGTDYVYESSNQGDNLTFLGYSGTVYSLAYGGRYRGVANPNALYIGSYDFSSGAPHLYVRTTGGFADVEASYNAAGGFLARDIVLDPQNYRRAFAVDYFGGIFATFNAGASWVNITGNLAALAPGGTPDPRSIAFIGNSQNYDSAVIAVGGYGGVYAVKSPGLAGTNPTWFKLGDGMSNALVNSLQYNIADDVLVAGTLGRGSWTLQHPTGGVTVPSATVTQLAVSVKYPSSRAIPIPVTSLSIASSGIRGLPPIVAPSSKYAVSRALIPLVTVGTNKVGIPTPPQMKDASQVLLDFVAAGKKRSSSGFAGVTKG
ncbi:WD40/YVTN/BNR-like repeat-containing protein [Tundrisphaera lichenicola]|uniref:WD40/YVTN/BNR-like repeat-containing protein n=1 Tax=Tundrisphaera lichenicola TaxID=2029860 RepID=UPI003EC04B25